MYLPAILLQAAARPDLPPGLLFYLLWGAPPLLYKNLSRGYLELILKWRSLARTENHKPTAATVATATR